MKPKIKRSHYRKNINQVYYLLKLKPLCNKIQKCAQIILLHDEFYTLSRTDKKLDQTGLDQSRTKKLFSKKIVFCITKKKLDHTLKKSGLINYVTVLGPVLRLWSKMVQDQI